MKLEIKNFRPEIKGISGDGIIKGYASTTDTDIVGDRIEKGAYNLAEKVRVLWQHDWGEPIGKPITIRPDEKGLYVKLQLLKDLLPTAQKAFICAKEGLIDSFSIGFVTNKSRYDGEVRVIEDLTIHEVSLVTFPANKNATVDAVKSDAPFPSIDECLSRYSDELIRKSEAPFPTLDECIKHYADRLVTKQELLEQRALYELRYKLLSLR